MRKESKPKKQYFEYKVLSGGEDIDKLLEAKKLILEDLIYMAIDAYCMYGDLDDLKQNKDNYNDTIGFTFQWAYRAAYKVINEREEFSWLKSGYSKFINYIANEYVSLRKKEKGVLCGKERKLLAIINKSNLYDCIFPKQVDNTIKSRLFHINIVIDGEAPYIVNSKYRATIDTMQVERNEAGDWVVKISYQGNLEKVKEAPVQAAVKQAAVEEKQIHELTDSLIKSYDTRIIDIPKFEYENSGYVCTGKAKENVLIDIKSEVESIPIPDKPLPKIIEPEPSSRDCGPISKKPETKFVPMTNPNEIRGFIQGHILNLMKSKSAVGGVDPLLMEKHARQYSHMKFNSKGDIIIDKALSYLHSDKYDTGAWQEELKEFIIEQVKSY